MQTATKPEENLRERRERIGLEYKGEFRQNHLSGSQLASVLPPGPNWNRGSQRTEKVLRRGELRVVRGGEQEWRATSVANFLGVRLS